jgi:hypothetical protein
MCCEGFTQKEIREKLKITNQILREELSGAHRVISLPYKRTTFLRRREDVLENLQKWRAYREACKEALQELEKKYCSSLVIFKEYEEGESHRQPFDVIEKKFFY